MGTDAGFQTYFLLQFWMHKKDIISDTFTTLINCVRSYFIVNKLVYFLFIHSIFFFFGCPSVSLENKAPIEFFLMKTHSVEFYRIP